MTKTKNPLKEWVNCYEKEKVSPNSFWRYSNIIKKINNF